MELREISIKDWNEMKKQRDESLIEWEKGVEIKRCECGNAYSYGYFPVYEDPGACQHCRGAEGDLVP